MSFTVVRDTAEKVQQAFRLFLNVSPNVTSWSPANDEFSLVFEVPVFDDHRVFGLVGAECCNDNLRHCKLTYRDLFIYFSSGLWIRIDSIQIRIQHFSSIRIHKIFESGYNADPDTDPQRKI
jgi:hypothetical protein